MLLATLCLQVSLLAHPLYLEDEPPEVRSARNILIRYDGAERVDEPVGRTREEALEMAGELVARLRRGEPFAPLAARYSEAFNAKEGGVLGTFPYGLLEGPLDAFLFGAEVGEVSDPILARGGVHVLERLETFAAVRHILLTGPTAEERARKLHMALRAGAEFAELAREHSADQETRDRGGAFAIYERGTRDRLLKAAAFQIGEGDVTGPIQTPMGWHLLQRVPVDSLDPALRETTMVRAEGILVSYTGAVGAPGDLHRLQEDAQGFAQAILRDVAGGKPFAQAARDFNDDLGGKERAGDLGWIHRRNPDLPLFMDRLFMMRPGEVLDEPITTAAGYVLLRRVR